MAKFRQRSGRIQGGSSPGNDPIVDRLIQTLTALAAAGTAVSPDVIKSVAATAVPVERFRGQREQLETRLKGRLDELGLRQTGQVGLVRARGAEQRANRAFGAGLAQTQAEQTATRAEQATIRLADAERAQLQILKTQARERSTGTRIRRNDPVIQAIAADIGNLQRIPTRASEASAVTTFHENQVAQEQRRVAAEIEKPFRSRRIRLPADDKFIQDLTERVVTTGEPVPAQEIRDKLLEVQQGRRLEKAQARVTALSERLPGGEKALSGLAKAPQTLKELSVAERNLPGLAKAARLKGGLGKAAGAAGLAALILPALFRSIKGDDQPKNSQLSPEIQQLLFQQIAGQQQQGASGRDLLGLDRALRAVKSLQELTGQMNQPLVRGVV